MVYGLDVFQGGAVNWERVRPEGVRYFLGVSDINVIYC